MVPRLHMVLLLALVTLVPATALAAANSLVGWVASCVTPTPEEATGLLADPAGLLRLQWRPAGEDAWSGSVRSWTRGGAEGLSGKGSGDGLLEATVEVTGYHGGLRLRVTATPMRDCATLTDVVLTCPFDPAQWERLIIPRLPYLQQAPGEKARLRFAADAGDVTSYEEAPQSAFYPFGVLEDECCFVLWGATTSR